MKIIIGLAIVFAIGSIVRQLSRDPRGPIDFTRAMVSLSIALLLITWEKMRHGP